MKKNLIKKVFAVSLSIAMACSFLPAANPVTASAAAPYVSLKTTFKTLKVGQKYKMTLKNNKINWKIKKVETTDKTIATVYGKTTSQVMIKGKSEGRATVRVKLKTTKRKANNTKTLRCRVKVVTSSPTVDPTPEVQTDATVTTQAELDAALKESSINKITIRPTTAVNFVIAQGSYSNVDLIVDAPLSDIENNAVFKSITINNIKAETWTEKAQGNTFSILAKAARLIVDKAASVKGITVGTTDAKVDVVVNGGTVSGINVNAKATLNIKGTAAENAALIPVVFSAGAANSVFVTELPVAVSMSASVELTFEKGAVKSTVKLEVTNIKATITNNTAETIVVTKNDNSKQNVLAGTKKATVNSTSTTGPVNPGTSGGTSGGSSAVKPATPYKISTGAGISIAVSGQAYGVKAVSNSAIGIRVSNMAVTPAAVGAKLPDVECTIVAKAVNGDWTRTIGTMDITPTDRYDYTENGTTKVGYTYPEESAWKRFNINGAPVDTEIQFTVSCRVKETATNAAGTAVQFTSTKFKVTGNTTEWTNIVLGSATTPEA